MGQSGNSINEKQITPDMLPKPNASHSEIIAFCQQNDPSLQFKELLGDKYNDHVIDLWSKSTHSFKSAIPTGYNINEILLCMAYDISVAPYIGVPIEISISYLNYMLNELREKY